MLRAPALGYSVNAHTVSHRARYHGRVSRADDDSLYDAWLDRALAGDVEDPSAFCARHGRTDGALQQRLAGLVLALTGEAPVEDADAAAVTPDAEDDLPFERLGGFRLLRTLGAGGMGVVYLAEQERLARLVALKVIRPELASSPTVVRRFTREAKALARLRHRHVVSVLDAGEDDGVLWFAMELVPGRSLATLLADEPGPLDVTRVVRWGRDIARALAAAHAEGLLHRDVKPGNLRIGSDDRALLIDFGLVRDLTGSDVTVTASFAGSPAYAAPEQLEGGVELDERADVYALGATLYEALAGRVPFEADSLAGLAQLIARDDPVPPRSLRPELPRDLETVLLTALERDRDRRYADAAAFADDLDAVLHLRPIAARPPGLVRRGRQWLRRHRRVTALLAVGLVGIAAAVVVSVTASLADRAEAHELIQEAERLLSDFDASRAQADRDRWRRRSLGDALERRWLEDSERRDLEARELAVRDHARKRTEAFTLALEHLSRARQLHPDAPGLRAGFASYYLQRWLDVRGDEDPTVAETFRRRVLEHDPDGRYADAVRGTAPMAFDSDPPGARVRLYRYVDGLDAARVAEPRLVLTPVRDPAQRAATAPTLERPGPDDDALLGVTPLAAQPMLPGWYLALMDAPGHVTQPVPFHVDHAVEHYSKAIRLAPHLLPEEHAVPGFRWIAAGAFPWGETSYFMAEHEVSVDDYATWLTELGQTDPAAAAAHLPVAPPDGRPWTLDERGRVALAPGATPDQPVLGVRWSDAVAYARWWNATRNPRPDAQWADLPSHHEWIRAGFGGDGRHYPFGMTFRPHWVSSRFGRREPGPSAVGSHPVDVSPWGIADLSGSAAEWLRDDGPDGQRFVAGGSWDASDPAVFRIDHKRAVPAGHAEPGFGFRLVIRLRGEHARRAGHVPER